MAVFAGSPTESTEYTAAVAAPLDNTFGGARFKTFTYTHSAGAGTGEVNLVKLPRGKITIKPTYSRLVAALTNTPDITIGYRAYIPSSGSGNADADAIYTATEVATGTIVPTAADFQVWSQTGLIVYLAIATANIADTDTLSGWIAYRQEDER